MTQVYILVGVGLVLLIVGIISARISFEKGKGVIAVFSAVLAIIGMFVTYLGYDTFMIQPQEFTITDIREIDSGYRLTIDSNIKGTTYGTIYLTREEANTLGLLIPREDGSYEISDVRQVQGSKRWVENHRM